MASSRLRLPNLVIAGVGKAGTSSLFRYLSQHPDICGSLPKELRYFSPLRYGEELPAIEEYSAHFEHCGAARYAMEATPGYFFGGAELIAALEYRLQEPRVIVILRDPVTRFWSYYNFQRSREDIDADLSFDDYFDRCQQLRFAGLDGAKENNAYWALSSGIYADYIEDWFEALGDRFRVIFFEHMIDQPRQVCNDLFGWLDIDVQTANAIDYAAVNPTVQYRNAVVRSVAANLSVKLKPWLTQRPRLRRRLRDAHLLLNRDPKKDLTFSSDYRERLREFYDPANERLVQQLRARGEIELPPWLESTVGSPKHR